MLETYRLQTVRLHRTSLGIYTALLPPNILHEFDLPVAILKINALRVECNITGGAYINERRAHTVSYTHLTLPTNREV